MDKSEIRKEAEIKICNGCEIERPSNIRCPFMRCREGKGYLQYSCKPAKTVLKIFYLNAKKKNFADNAEYQTNTTIGGY